ncbi:MAG TPA: hypothetical protein VFU07_05575 [Candidatus Lumbricidophila sp.]|nr:hypothetical protein [Candidatus Lumbricidophila sp.]
MTEIITAPTEVQSVAADADGVTAAAPAKKSRKNLIIGLAAAAVVLLGGGSAIAVPNIIAANEHSAALSAYQAASKKLTAAQADIDAAAKADHDARTTSVDAWALYFTVADIAAKNPAMIDPSANTAALQADVDAYAKTYQIVLGEGNKTWIARVDLKITLSTDGTGLTDKATTKALTAGTKTINATIADAAVQIKKLQDKQASIAPSLAKLRSETLVVMGAAEKSATSWARPGLTDDAAWAAYTASVEAIKAANLTDKTNLSLVLQQYIDARVAAQANNDAAQKAKDEAAAEAARKAAIERPAYQAPNQSSGSGAGGSTGGSSSSGGGSSGGGRISPNVPRGSNQCPPGMNCSL